MSSSYFSLYKPSQSSKALSYEEAKKLLSKQIPITATLAEDLTLKVTASVQEVFASCKKQLKSTSEFRNCEMSIKGSAVTSLVASLSEYQSAEEYFSDIDISVFVDLTDDPERAFSTGSRIKWTLLEAIKEVAKDKIPKEHLESFNRAPLDCITFFDKTIPLHSRKLKPFNVHILEVDSLEFTCVALVERPEKLERKVDFTCSSLELTLDDKNQAVLQTSLPNIEEVISDIQTKTLKCFDVGELTQKPFARYFLKVISPGYVDYNLLVLKELMSSFAKRRVENPQITLEQEIVEEACSFFLERKRSPLEPLIYLLTSLEDSLEMKELFVRAKAQFFRYLAGSSSKALIHLSNLIKDNKPSELAWTLLLLAQSIEKIDFENQSFFKIRISSRALFDNIQERPIFFHLAISSLQAQFWESDFTFYQDLNCYPMDPRELKDETKESLQKATNRLFTRQSSFSVFHAVSKKFQLKKNDLFAKAFFDWFSNLSKENKGKVSLLDLSDAIGFLDVEGGIQVERSLEVGELFLKRFKELKVNFFENHLQLEKFLLFSETLLKNLRKLGDQDKEISLSFAKQIADDFESFHHASLEERSIYVKKMAFFNYILFSKNRVDLARVIQSAKECIDHDFFEPSLELTAVLIKANDPTFEDHFLSFLEKISEKNRPLVFSFLQKQNEQLTKTDLFQSQLKLYFKHQASVCKTQKEQKELTNLQNLLLSKKKLQELRGELIEKASRGCLESTEFFNRSIYLFQEPFFDFFEVESLSKDQLLFLKGYKEFNSRFLKDSQFAFEVSKIAYRAQIDEIVDFGFSALAENAPELFFSLFDFCNEKELSYDKKLKMANALLEHISKEHVKENIESFCFHLLSYLPAEFAQRVATNTADTLIDEITLFHKKFFLRSLNNVNWVLFWGILDETEVEKGFDKWFDVKEFTVSLDKNYKNQHICLSLAHFRFDFQMLEPILEQIVSIFEKEEVQEKEYLDPIVYQILKSMPEELWKIAPKQVSPNLAVANHLNELANFYFTYPDNLKENQEIFNMLMDTLKASVHFGDREIRASVALKIFALIQLRNEQVSRNFFLSGKGDRIILSIINRAVLENESEELADLYDLYFKLFSVEVRGVTFRRLTDSLLDITASEFTPHFDLWKKHVQKLIKSERENPNVELLNFSFFLRFLSDMNCSLIKEIERVKETEAGDSKELDHFIKVQHLCFGYIKELFDLCIKRKRFDLAQALEISFSYFNHFSPNDMEEMTKRFFRTTQELSLICRKKELEDDEVDVLNKLIHLSSSAFQLLASLSNVEMDEESVVNLIEAIRVPLCYAKEDRIQTRQNLNILCLFESSLSQAQLKAYILRWGKSICERKESVSFRELNLFSQICLTTDAKIGRILSKTVHHEKFRDKQVLGLRFFDDPKNIILFLEIFDIAFKRFSDLIPKEGEVRDDQYTGIFASFLIFSLYIRDAIPNFKSKHEIEKHLRHFLHVLAHPLKQNPSHLSLRVVGLCWNCMFCLDGNGEVRLRFEAPEDLAINCEIFYDLTQKIARMPEQSLVENGINFRYLQSVFSRYKGKMSKGLKEEKTLELMELLGLNKSSVFDEKELEELTAFFKKSGIN